MSNAISLRPITESDLPTLFEQQFDPIANRMAAFPARDREAFFAHWTKILANDPAAKYAIVTGGRIAGLVLSWDFEGKRMVGYWIGRDFWGQGIASRALELFLDGFETRPLHALVAKHNVASIRVLEKCGFKLVGEDRVHSQVHGHEVDTAGYLLSD